MNARQRWAVTCNGEESIVTAPSSEAAAHTYALRRKPELGTVLTLTVRRLGSRGAGVETFQSTPVLEWETVRASPTASTATSQE